MNENSFFYTLDKIDDKFIEEAAETDEEFEVQPLFARPEKRSKKPIFAIALTAACFALIFAVGTALKNNRGIEITQPPVNLAETTAETAKEETDTAQTTLVQTTPAQTEIPGAEITDESGNRFTLYGEPIGTDKLIDFDYEESYLYSISKDSEISDFFNELDIPDKEEIIELYHRGQTLRSISNGNSLLKWEFNPARIKVDDEEYFRIYFESGISYESYYKALSDVFTEETAEAFIQSSCNSICPFSYNKELWVQGGEPSPNLHLRHEEYYLVKSDENELIFTTVQYMTGSLYVQRFYPELRDQYMVTSTENIFVKTDGGWRIKDICVNNGSLVNEEADIERNYWQARRYGELEERWNLNKATVMPLPSNWTEETVKSAWSRFRMAEINKARDDNAEYYSNNAYLDRIFYDCNNDGKPEMLLTDIKGNMYLFDDEQEIILCRSQEQAGGIYVSSAVTDKAELERLGADYYENEAIYKTRELKIFTDSEGRFYYMCAYFDLNHWKYYLYELSTEKAAVVPAYKWGEFTVFGGNELDYETRYVKFTDEGEISIAQQELEGFINSLSPAQ